MLLRTLMQTIALKRTLRYIINYWKSENTYRITILLPGTVSNQ